MVRVATDIPIRMVQLIRMATEEVVVVAVVVVEAAAAVMAATDAHSAR